jgi:hypothetical protein
MCLIIGAMVPVGFPARLFGALRDHYYIRGRGVDFVIAFTILFLALTFIGAICLSLGDHMPCWLDFLFFSCSIGGMSVFTLQRGFYLVTYRSNKRLTALLRRPALGILNAMVVGTAPVFYTLGTDPEALEGSGDHCHSAAFDNTLLVEGVLLGVLTVPLVLLLRSTTENLQIRHELALTIIVLVVSTGLWRVEREIHELHIFHIARVLICVALLSFVAISVCQPTRALLKAFLAKKAEKANKKRAIRSTISTTMMSINTAEPQGELQDVLDSPERSISFHKFLEKDLCSENINFLQELKLFRTAGVSNGTCNMCRLCNCVAQYCDRLVAQCCGRLVAQL